MIKNYFRTALRNLARNKLYSFLNIVGLAIGIACCTLIILYVQDEMSFDRFHDNAERIYRIVPTFKTSERTMLMGTTAHAQAPMLQDEYPEIENYVRFTSYSGPKIIEYADRRFNEDKFLHVDQSFFEVFSFKLVKGNRLDALVNPYSVVITEEMALKYFGDENPLGKQLKINANDLYQVTGVLENIPQNSHIRPDFFGSFSTLNLEAKGNAVVDLLNSINYYSYLQLRAGTDYKVMEEKFISFIDKHLGAALKQIGGEARLEMQPLTSIHLHSDRENELERNSDITYVYLFSGIGLFILLLACLNFMNLATARSANRAKEVGLRKVVGAHRRQLIKQFLGESFLLTFISLVLSLLLVYLMLPLFQKIAGKHLNSDMLGNPLLFGGLAVLLLFIGFVGGSYPAFFLSAFKPVDVLQGKFKRGAKSSLLRIVLVSLQFTVSIVLIIGTLVVNRQLNFIQNKNLGYDKDHVVTIRVRNAGTMNQIETIRSEFLKNPMVLNVSASSTPPIGISDFSIHHAVGKPPDEQIMLSSQMVDEHFLDTYKIELVAGRNFSNEYPTDITESIIMNETAVKRLGWEANPLDQQIERYTDVGLVSTKKWRVVGVVKDYHFQSFHEPISPMVLYNNPVYTSAFSLISVRLRPEDIQNSIAFLKTKWAEFDSMYPFEFDFVDNRFNELYRSEQRLQQLFGIFTILAVIIGCLGLFGLTSFTAEQRTREIGIRKVLGASVKGIIWMQVRDFTKWVLLAIVVAWPLGYFVMHKWLQNFAYRTSLSLTVFLYSACLALIISILTVSYQTVKAALTDPSIAIKYE